MLRLFFLRVLCAPRQRRRAADIASLACHLSPCARVAGCRVASAAPRGATRRRRPSAARQLASIGPVDASCCESRPRASHLSRRHRAVCACCVTALCVRVPGRRVQAAVTVGGDTGAATPAAAEERAPFYSIFRPQATCCMHAAASMRAVRRAVVNNAPLRSAQARDRDADAYVDAAAADTAVVASAPARPPGARPRGVFRMNWWEPPSPKTQRVCPGAEGVTAFAVDDAPQSAVIHRDDDDGDTGGERGGGVSGVRACVSCVVCRVSCVVCRVSCVVRRVSCVVCRVSCVVCRVSSRCACVV
jgi:hypothetical protein